MGRSSTGAGGLHCACSPRVPGSLLSLSHRFRQSLLHPPAEDDPKKQKSWPQVPGLPEAPAPEVPNISGELWESAR